MSIKKIPSPTGDHRSPSRSIEGATETSTDRTPSSHPPQESGSPHSCCSRRTTSSDSSDRCSNSDDDTWWRESEPLCASRSSSSCRSEAREDFRLSELDLSSAKLPVDESWWVPLAQDTLRLAEDFALAISPKGLFPSRSGKQRSFEDWPGRLWRRLRRYRHFVLFVSVVTVVNGFFSLLLLQCLWGSSKVCMFGSCHSPQATQGMSLAYDRTTLNMTSKSAPTASALTGLQETLPGQASSEEDDEAFLNSLEKNWEVAPHPSVPRAYMLRKVEGHFRAMLVQDVCYLYMQGTGPEHGRATGVWFDADALTAVRQGDRKSLLDSRDLQKLDMFQLVAPDEGESVHKGVFRVSADVIKIQKRVNRTVGSFVGPRSLISYLELSSGKASKLLKMSAELKPELVGVVGGFESHISSFSNHAVFLSEVTSPASGYWSQATVFFPGDRKIWSQWTAGALKAVVGKDMVPVPGQVLGQPFCFRNALFFMNERPAASVEVDNFRQKTWTTADSVTDFFKTAGHLLPSPEPQMATSASLPLVQKVVDTANEDVKLQLGCSADLVRSAQLFNRVAHARSHYQITILVDSTAKGEDVPEVESSKIANLAAVAALVRRMFPKLEVQFLSLTESSFVEQVAVFKRTVLLIAPWASTAGSLVFLPRSASMVEIFPLKFRSEATASSAKSAGVNYFKWENDKLTNSKYEGDCLAGGNFEGLSEQECRRLRPCLFCVRDHVSTTVDRKELRSVLLSAQQAVKGFLQEKATKGWSPL